MNTRFLVSLTSLCLLGCSTDGVAQGGAVPVRVPDGDAIQCINPATDRLWITLRRLVVDKSKRFLREDTSVALLVNASVKVQPATPKPITFPLISQATLRGFTPGQVSVPVEYTIVDGLPLSQDEFLYTGAALELTILNKSGRTPWGKALQALAETADKLPIPANPMGQTATYLLEFANSAIAKEIEEQKADDKSRSATLALNFDPSGACAGGADSDFESTGTIAILQESGTRGTGYVPIDQTNSYCWDADFRPTFVLKAAKKNAGRACNDPAYEPEFEQVTNNYIAFVVNAVPISTVLGADDVEERINTALSRCATHGIAAEDC